MRLSAIVLVTILPLSACDCGSDPEGGGETDNGGTNTNGDGTGDNDGAVATNDGAPNDDDGGPGTDGGNPLEQPLSEFCTGEGTVVAVNNTGDCAGEIAENIFQFALCACETIDVQSTLDLDAFDSRRGPYGTATSSGANILDDGHLGLNGALAMDGKLTVRGSAFVGGGGFSVGSQSSVASTVYAYGDAVQENSSTTFGRNAYFSGNVTGRFDIAGDLHVSPTATVAQQVNYGGSLIREVIPAVRPCACEPNELLDIAAITEFGRTTNDNDVLTSTMTMTLTSTAYENGGPATLRLPCGRYYLTRIQQPAGLSIIAEGRTVLFVDGDFTIGGNFDLSLEPGAEVDIFVKGSLSVGASARFGDPDQPSSVRTYVGGDGAIVLSASAVFGGNLYAPRAAVSFDASSELYGALFARTASFDGSANIHFDTAVRSAGDECDEEVPGDDGGISGDPDAAGDAGDAGDSPAPCMDDLDCPAPRVCVEGVCTLNL